MSISKKISIFVFVGILVVGGLIFNVKNINSGPPSVSTITEAVAPAEVLATPVVTGEANAVIATSTFSLVQASGSATLTSVEIEITDPLDSGLIPSDIASVSLRKESGANPDFQVGEDLIVAGAVANNPGISSPTLTSTVPEVIGATPVQYYIVATVGATPTTNHNFAIGFSVSFYAIASDGSVSGTELIPTKKVVFGTIAPPDSTPPTLDTGNTGPSNNATNVPTSSFIHVGFSEFLDQSTLNSSNISFTKSGVPVPAGIRSFPNGFDLVISNPPTFSPSSRYAQLPTVSTGFYQMQGIDTITPQGTYTSPVVGNIVYFQTQSFAPEVGIVTDATLTSGTFAVNNFNLFGGQMITKIATPSTTGLVSGTNSVDNGNIIVLNSTANPTAQKYDWHIVTTGGLPINDSGVRIDGSVSAPTFAPGSSFSTIRPRLTATDNGADVGEFLSVVVGDLVFAKIADGNYGWHLVTGAGDLSSDAGEGTAILDGTDTASSLVASGSQMSILESTSQGAVTDNVTTYNMGNIIFAKTTANASANGAYNFHLVTESGTISSSTIRFDNSFSNLDASSTYVVTAGVGVTDQAGNPLAAPAVITFTTGSNTGENNAPPFVQSSTPASGNQNYPRSAPISIQFSVPMAVSGGGSVLSSSNIGLFLASNGGPGTPVSATNTYNSSTKQVTITPATTLSALTDYVVKVFPTATSETGANASNFQLFFRTNSGATDTTRPNVVGVFPSPGSTDIVRPVGDINIGFSEDMDPSTITSSSITVDGGITGTVSYDGGQRQAHFSPNTPLAASNQYIVTVLTGPSGVKDLSGNELAGNGGVENAVTVNGSSSSYIYSFLTDSSAPDASAPYIEFAIADDFGVALTFSEPMKSGGGPSAVDNIANYTLQNPVGTTVSLGGKTVTYDAPTMTAIIDGLSLQNGVDFKITGSNLLRDLSDNPISTVSNANVAFGTVQDSDVTGGYLGFDGQQQDPGEQGMNPIRVMPMTRTAGATSNYGIEFPVGSQEISVGGSIVLTFPSGFDVTNTAAMTAITESPANADINGPGSGVVTIASVTNNTAARTITIVTAGASTGTDTFLHFDLKNIINSSVPSSGGYTVDIKTKNTSNVLLETKTSAPFFLGQAGTSSLFVQVFKDANSNLSMDVGEGIGGATVFLFSPATGGIETTTSSGGPDAGTAAFSNLSDGQYMVGIKPNALIDVPFNSAPQPITISGITTKDFILSNATALTISGTITGAVDTIIDVFASSNQGFTLKKMTLTGGADAYSLPVSANSTYNVGVGPAIPDMYNTPGSPPPPPPVFTFMPPQPLNVNVALFNVTGKNFTLTTASKTITGTVLDSASNGINNAQVYARPITESTSGGAAGFGTGAATNTQGAFTLNVVPGVYLVGAFKPGMPNIPEKQITVPVSGANTPTSLTFTVNATTSLSITGSISDEDGNATPYAGVNARKVDPDNTEVLLGAGNNNFVGGPTDANGAYTLYVTAGTWVVEAFAPGYGLLGTKTIVISTSNITAQNFSAGTVSIGTITGQALQNSVATQGVMVRAEGSNGKNMAVTDSDGNYTLKVPAGSYTLYCYFPTIGEASPVTGITVTSGVTTSAGTNCTSSAPITITVKLTDGINPISNAFVDVRNSTGRGNGTSVSTSSGIYATYVVSVAPGTYTVRAGHPSFGMLGTTASVSDTPAEPITYTATAGTTYAVTGTVTGDASALGGAWVSLIGIPTGQTNTINIGAQTGPTGTFTISAPAGSYTIRADKPGYKSPSAATVTVTTSAVAVGTIALTTASKTITGTVTLGGSPVSGAFVDAKDTAGGFAVAQTDVNGAYSLAVDTGTWTLYAHTMGYDGGPLPVSVTSSNVTGQTITLSAISGFTINPEKMETLTPTTGGFIQNSDISGFKLNIPANALGTSSNPSTITTQKNSNMPNPPTGSILSKDAVTINAVGADGQSIKSLSDNVTITIPYTEADLEVGTDEEDLVIGVWNDATQNYDTLSTIVDPVADTLTATVAHFSDFAPLVSSEDISTPSTPTGLAVGSATTTTLALSWTQTSGATSYDIYRSTTSDGTYARLGSEPTVSSGSTTTYSDTGLTAGTTYYYKISALNGSGESAATTTPVSGTTTSSGGGGGGGGGGNPPVDSIPPTGTSININTGASSASSATVTLNLTATGASEMMIANDSTFTGGVWTAYTPSKEWTLTSGNGVKTVYVKFRDTAGNISVPVSDLISLVVTSDTSNTPTEAQSPVLESQKPPFTKALILGSVGDDVSRFQQFLKDEGVYPAGIVNGRMGPLTVSAVKRFQEKYSIAKSGDSGYGVFGPKTRAKVNSLQGSTLSTGESSTGIQLKYNLGTAILKNGSRGEAVKKLQRFLNEKLQLGLVVDGKLGPKTIAVIKQWQKDNNLSPDGLIGSKTKALMNSSVQ